MCTLQFIANKFHSAVNLPASRHQHKKSQQRLQQSPHLIDCWMGQSFFDPATRARFLTESIFGNSRFFFKSYLFVKKHQLIYQCAQLSTQPSARQELASVTQPARWPRRPPAHPGAAVPLWPLESALEPPFRADPARSGSAFQLANHSIQNPFLPLFNKSKSLLHSHQCIHPVNLPFQ